MIQLLSSCLAYTLSLAMAFSQRSLTDIASWRRDQNWGDLADYTFEDPCAMNMIMALSPSLSIYQCCGCLCKGEDVLFQNFVIDHSWKPKYTKWFKPSTTLSKYLSISTKPHLLYISISSSNTLSTEILIFGGILQEVMDFGNEDVVWCC